METGSMIKLASQITGGGRGGEMTFRISGIGTA